LKFEEKAKPKFKIQKIKERHKRQSPGVKAIKKFWHDSKDLHGSKAAAQCKTACGRKRLLKLFY